MDTILLLCYEESTIPRDMEASAILVYHHFFRVVGECDRPFFIVGVCASPNYGQDIY